MPHRNAEGGNEEGPRDRQAMTKPPHDRQAMTKPPHDRKAMAKPPASAAAATPPLLVKLGLLAWLQVDPALRSAIAPARRGLVFSQ
jgi:hypothetical protein